MQNFKNLVAALILTIFVTAVQAQSKMDSKMAPKTDTTKMMKDKMMKQKMEKKKMMKNNKMKKDSTSKM